MSVNSPFPTFISARRLRSRTTAKSTQQFPTTIIDKPSKGKQSRI